MFIFLSTHMPANTAGTSKTAHMLERIQLSPLATALSKLAPAHVNDGVYPLDDVEGHFYVKIE